MPFWEHVADLRRALVNVFLIFFAIFILTFVFGLEEFEVLGNTVVILYPNINDNIASLFFNQMTSDLLPSEVELITISPLDAIMANLQISMFLGFAIGMPFFVYQLGNFIGPGLYPHERRLILKITVPATLLFIIGCLIAYYFVVPFAFDFLYGYTSAMGAHPFLSVSEFISFVLIFILFFGIVFELPVIMVGITLVGIVQPEFWKKHWRGSCIAIFIIAAVITPDGSGITQVLVAVPMIVLYFIGYVASKHYYRKIKVTKAK